MSNIILGDDKVEEKRKKEEILELILNKLDELYGTAKEGFYHKEPWQLLTAIMLSAQSTDKQVEEVLPRLFQKYNTIQKIAQASTEEIEFYIRSVGLYKNKAKNIKKCLSLIHI